MLDNAKCQKRDHILKGILLILPPLSPLDVNLAETVPENSVSEVKLRHTNSTAYSIAFPSLPH